MRPISAQGFTYCIGFQSEGQRFEVPGCAKLGRASKCEPSRPKCIEFDSPRAEMEGKLRSQKLAGTHTFSESEKVPTLERRI